MSAILDAFASKKSFLSEKGASNEQISRAEHELGLSFSEEYRQYLFEYGIAAFDGHEMTGISESKRLNVVFVTTEARERYPEIPADLYVIEETGIEEFIVLQSANGAVYGYAPNYKLTKIHESLCDYITAQKTM